MDYINKIDIAAIKLLGSTLSKFLTEYMLIIKCAAQNCTKEIGKAKDNSQLYQKYELFQTEPNKTKKLKILAELSKHGIMYEINNCVIKNCKTLVKDILQTFRTYLTIISKSNPKYNTIEKIINELETLTNNKTLTEKKYKINIKKINILISTLND